MNKNLNLIGISGKKGRGKDTVAAMIQKSRPQYQIRKFSGRLKEIVSILTGVDVSLFESEEVKSRRVPQFGGRFTLRQLLQFIGTDLLRTQLHQDVWVDSLMMEYSSNQKWLISDVRFPNEAEAIKALGGLVIRVDRDGPHDPHPSETALDEYDFDCVIDNNGSLKDLTGEVHKWITENLGN